MAASTFATAGKYSPVSGLITDNNYNQYVKKPLALTSGLGGAKGFGMLNTGTVTPTSTPGAAAGAPGAPGAPGSITAGGYTPDWAKLIEGDAGLIDAKNAVAAGGAGDLAARNAQIQRALVDFGSVPDVGALAKSLGLTQTDLQGVAGADIQKLAQENTDAGVSTKARLAQANNDAIRTITDQLNARGLLNSGETGFQLDRQNTGFRQAESDATGKLLDYLNQYQQGYAQAQAQRAQTLAGAYSSAADRQYQTNQGGAGVTATETAPGSGIYRAPDGSLYNKDGSPYTAPDAPPPPPPATTHAPVNPVAAIPGNPYQAAAAPGGGNLYGTLDPAIAGLLVNRKLGGTRSVAA